MNLETAPQELQDILDRLDHTPMGDEAVSLVRRALDYAETNELPGWAYQLRLWYNSSVFRMGDTNALLTSFTKALAIHDSDPQRFPLELDEDTHLLFQYKWVAEMLNDSPDYSLAQINAIYGDMERRFREAGKSPSGYLQTRFGGACERGEWDDAAQFYTELQAAPRDDLSHCEACYRSTAAMYYADRGDADRALELLEEIFSGQYVCGDEPEYSESQAMLLHLRKGNLDEAKRLHYKSLAAVVQNPEPSGIVLRHVLFCIITGNTARALDLLERNARLFDASELNVARQFDALTLLGVLADALEKEGRGDVPIRGTGSHYYEVVLTGIAAPAHGTDYTARELTAFVWSKAEGIVEKFNARNGNDHYTKRLEARKALLTTRYDLPIGLEEFEPIESAVVAEPEVPLETVSDYVAAIANALPGNLDEASRLLDELASLAADETGLDQADALFHILHIDLDAPTNVSPLTYEKISERYRSLGLTQFADAMLSLRSRIAGELTPEDIATLTEVAKDARDVEPRSAGYAALLLAERLVYTASDLANLHLSTALETLETLPAMQRAAIIMVDLLLRDQEIMQARQALKQAEGLSYGARSEDIEISNLQARIALWSEKFDDAEQAFKRSLDIALSAGDHARAWPILSHMARVYAGNNEPVAAVRVLSRAYRYAQATGASEEDLTSINFALGTQLVNADQAHDALGPLTQVVNWNLENDAPIQQVTAALMSLGEAALRAGEFQQAFSAWFFGLNLSEEKNQPDAQYAFAVRLADFLTQSEHPDAFEFAEKAYKVAQEQGNPVQTLSAAKRIATANVLIGKNNDFSVMDKALLALPAGAANESPDVAIARIEAELHRARLLWRLGEGIASGMAALKAADIAQELELGEAQFDALVLAGVAFKDAGETERAREALTHAQAFSQPGESPYEFVAQQLSDL